MAGGLIEGPRSMSMLLGARLCVSIPGDLWESVENMTFDEQ